MYAQRKEYLSFFYNLQFRKYKEQPYKNQGWHFILYFKGLFLFPITFAGIPPTIDKAGTSLVTTAPAATTAPSPIVTPGRIIALVHIHA